MTDITELALLVRKAKAAVFTLEYISQFEPADIDSDDVDLRFEVDGRDTGTNVSIVDECGQAARVIGALVEALEKAQAKNALVAGGIEASTKLHERIADLEGDVEKWKQESASWEAVANKQLGIVADLESRTFTVKLPDDEDGQAYGFGKWANRAIPAAAGTMMISYCEDAWRAAFEVFSNAAGIKWEAE